MNKMPVPDVLPVLVERSEEPAKRDTITPTRPHMTIEQYRAIERVREDMGDYKKTMPRVKKPRAKDDDVKRFHVEEAEVPKFVVVETPFGLWERGRRAIIKQNIGAFRGFENEDQRSALLGLIDQIDECCSAMRDQGSETDYGIELELDEKSKANAANSHDYIKALTTPNKNDDSSVAAMRELLFQFATDFKLDTGDDEASARDDALRRRLTALSPRIIAGRLDAASAAAGYGEWNGDLSALYDNNEQMPVVPGRVVDEMTCHEIDGADGDATRCTQLFSEELQLTCTHEDTAARSDDPAMGRTSVTVPKLRANGQALVWCPCACCNTENPVSALASDSASGGEATPKKTGFKKRELNATAADCVQSLKDPDLGIPTIASHAKRLEDAGALFEKEDEEDDSKGFEVASWFEMWEAQHRVWLLSKNLPASKHPLCLVKMLSAMLKAGLDSEVSMSMTCCSNLDCLEKMGMRQVDWRTRWDLSSQNDPNQNGSRRHRQKDIVVDNMMLMRFLFKNTLEGCADPMIGPDEGARLIEFFNERSQWTHEQEANALTIAIKIANGSGFKVSTPNSFVGSVHEAVFNYMNTVVRAHVYDTQRGYDAQGGANKNHNKHENKEWQQHLVNKILETAKPNGWDYCFLLMKKQVLSNGKLGFSPWWFVRDGLVDGDASEEDGPWMFDEDGIKKTYADWRVEKLSLESPFSFVTSAAEGEWDRCVKRGKLGLVSERGDAVQSDTFTTERFNEIWADLVTNGKNGIVSGVSQTFQPMYLGTEAWRSDDFASIRSALGGIPESKVHEMYRTLNGCGGRKRINVPCHIDKNDFVDKNGRVCVFPMDGTHRRANNTLPHLRMSNALAALGGVTDLEHAQLETQLRDEHQAVKTKQLGIFGDVKKLWPWYKKEYEANRSDSAHERRVYQSVLDGKGKVHDHMVTAMRVAFKKTLEKRRRGVYDDKRGRNVEELKRLGQAAEAVEARTWAELAALNANRAKELTRLYTTHVAEFEQRRVEIHQLGYTKHHARILMQECVMRQEIAYDSLRKNVDSIVEAKRNQAVNCSNKVTALAVELRDREFLDKAVSASGGFVAQMYDGDDEWWIDRTIDFVVKDLHKSPECAADPGMTVLAEGKVTLCAAQHQPYDPTDKAHKHKTVPVWYDVRNGPLDTVVVRAETPADIASRYGPNNPRAPSWSSNAVLFTDVGEVVKNVLYDYIHPHSWAVDPACAGGGTVTYLYDHNVFRKLDPRDVIKRDASRMEAQLASVICVPDWLGMLLEFVPSGTLTLVQWEANKTEDGMAKSSSQTAAKNPKHSDANRQMMMSGSPIKVWRERFLEKHGEAAQPTEEAFESLFSKPGGGWDKKQADHFCSLWTVKGARAHHRAISVGSCAPAAEAEAEAEAKATAPAAAAVNCRRRNERGSLHDAPVAAHGATSAVLVGAALGYGDEAEAGADAEAEAETGASKPSMLGFAANHVDVKQADGSVLREYDSERRFASAVEQKHHAHLHCMVGCRALESLQSMLAKIDLRKLCTLKSRCLVKINEFRTTLENMSILEEKSSTLRTSVLSLRLDRITLLHDAYAGLAHFVNEHGDMDLDAGVEPASIEEKALLELASHCEVILSASGSPAMTVGGNRFETWISNWDRAKAEALAELRAARAAKDEQRVDRAKFKLYELKHDDGSNPKTSKLIGHQPMRSTESDQHLWSMQCVRDDLNGTVRHDVLPVKRYLYATESRRDPLRGLTYHKHVYKWTLGGIVEPDDDNPKKPLVGMASWEMKSFCNEVWVYTHPARRPLFERMAIRTKPVFKDVNNAEIEKHFNEQLRKMVGLEGVGVGSKRTIDAMEAKQQAVSAERAAEAKAKAKTLGASEEDADLIYDEELEVPVFNSLLGGEDSPSRRAWAQREPEDGSVFKPVLVKTTFLQQLAVNYARFKIAKSEVALGDEKRQIDKQLAEVRGEPTAESVASTESLNARTIKYAEQLDLGRTPPRVPYCANKLKNQQTRLITAYRAHSAAVREGDAAKIRSAEVELEAAKFKPTGAKTLLNQKMQIETEVCFGAVKKAKRKTPDSEPEDRMAGHLGVLQASGALGVTEGATTVTIKQEHVDGLSAFYTRKRKLAEQKHERVESEYTKFARTELENSAEGRKTWREADPARDASLAVTEGFGAKESTFDDYIEENWSTMGRQYANKVQRGVAHQAARELQRNGPKWTFGATSRACGLEERALLRAQELEIGALCRFRFEEGVALADDDPLLEVNTKKENKAKTRGW
jgi:hypothetical protein